MSAMPWYRRRDMPTSAEPSQVDDLDLNNVTVAEIDMAILSHHVVAYRYKMMGDWGRAKCIDDRVDALLDARNRITIAATT